MAYIRFLLIGILYVLTGYTATVYPGKDGEVSPQFRAGTAKVNITPDRSLPLLGYGPRMSGEVRDSIYHRVVVMDDGETSFFLVSSDICSVDPSIYERVLDKLKRMYGIDRQNFWWSFTHTHSAPVVGPAGVFSVMLGHDTEASYDKEYVNFLEERLIQAVGEAKKAMVPARLGAGWGYSEANINRRARDKNNKTYLGENPDGEIDRKIGLLRLEKEDHSLLALIASYPIHGTVLPPSDKTISGDVAGTVSEYVEQQLGVPLLFINGAEGNVAPIKSFSGNLEQFKTLLGNKVIEANDRIGNATSQVKLSRGNFIFETPRHQRLTNWPVYLPDYLRVLSSGEALIRMPISFLFINDEIAIWSAPCELFCEVSNAVREKSSFPYTFYYGVTNGTLGYLPTRQEFTFGGYEVGVSPFTPDAAGNMERDVSEYLDNRYKRREIRHKK